MQTLRNILIVVFLQMCFYANAQNQQLPYVAYNASKGVILKSSGYHEEFYPVRGTKLFEKDTFLLKDEHCFVKIKDVESGEIFTFKGKGKRTPRQIANDYRYDSYDKFLSFLETIIIEVGFNTAPVRTTQCVTPKGKNGTKEDSLSLNVASQVKIAISDSIYEPGVEVGNVNSLDNETFYYSVRSKEKKDSIEYAIAVFTVGKNNIVNKHRLLINKYGRPRLDGIEYIPLIPNHTLNLSYFSFAKDDSITCYVLLFNPVDFYKKKEKKSAKDDDTYDCLLNWDLITKELIYQGNVNRVIYIKRE